MNVRRGGENQFTVMFDDSETANVERFAADDDKPAEDFICWLLSVGLEIFKLTLSSEET